MKSKYYYESPVINTFSVFQDMTKQSHLLIAGQTGSGKSVLLNNLIYTLLANDPEKVKFIFCDPKRVELARYKTLPHTVKYADDVPTMIQALIYAMDICERRFIEMQKKEILKYDGGHIYIIIDELADLMTTCKKEVTPLLQRLCQLGRAANVHVIACTQCPLAKIIPTEIKVNFESIIGLHVATRQHSRNILDMTGCELLPKYGKCIYKSPKGVYLHDVPMIDETTIQKAVDSWKVQPFKRSIIKRLGK